VIQTRRLVRQDHAAVAGRPWCVIPAAGRARRLGGQAAGRPKTLMRVGGRTLLERLVGGLAPEVGGVCVVVGTGAESLSVRAYLDLPMRSVVQSEPKGVADAIASAEGLIDGPFVVVMGDNFYERPVAPYVAWWRRSGLSGAVLVEDVTDFPSEPAGFVRIRGREVAAIWKGAATAGDRPLRRVAGMLILPHAAFRVCRELAPAQVTGELEVEDLTSRLLVDGHRFLALPYRGWRRNINTPKDVRLVEAHLASASQETRVS
jgi:dTDP-glucose pyrophosphorylase